MLILYSNVHIWFLNSETISIQIFIDLEPNFYKFLQFYLHVVLN